MQNSRIVSPWVTISAARLVKPGSSMSRQSVSMKLVTRSYTSAPLSPSGKRYQNVPYSSRSRLIDCVASGPRRWPQSCSRRRGSWYARTRPANASAMQSNVRIVRR
jgi:hypothetical protein